MSPSVIGVDLGGTKVATASLQGGRGLSQSKVQPTNLSDSGALLDQVVDLVQEARGDGLDAVGVGVPSVVDFETGRVVSSVNVPLTDIPLREVLGERLGVPVFVDNDATVAALAEAYDENLELLARNLVMITVGTGIGGGLVLGGRIYRGANGGAGELGHTLVGLDLEHGVPDPVRFPQPGSLEWVASGHAIDRLAAECARSAPASALGRQLAAGEEVLGPAAVRAAREGDADARRIIETWAGRLGIGVANAINTFDPDEVVIGGGAAQAGELLLEPARRVAFGYVLPGLGRRTKVRLAKHGVRAGVLGAALLALHELEEDGRGTRRAPRPAAGSTMEVR
ncbi:MAG: ROK family protein [Solirubrobacterales bacterium]|nr:ROK family protein [Solirubrobacterales bacterium]